MKKVLLIVLALFVIAFLSSCAGLNMKKLTSLPVFDKNTINNAENPAKSANQMHVINPGQPYIKRLPGPERIKKIAVKAFRYDKKKPNACRLEIIVYGGNKTNVEDAKWFTNWFNNEQTIVSPAEVKAYFINFDPNTCTWDRNGNGGYKCWVKKEDAPTLDLGTIDSTPAESE